MTGFYIKRKTGLNWVNSFEQNLENCSIFKKKGEQVAVVRRCSVKNLFREISEYSQENTYSGILFFGNAAKLGHNFLALHTFLIRT